MALCAPLLDALLRILAMHTVPMRERRRAEIIVSLNGFSSGLREAAAKLGIDVKTVRVWYRRAARWNAEFEERLEGALPEDRQRCLAAGMDGYVTKPVSRHALAEALEEWLPKETNPAPDATPGAAAASGRESGIRVFDKAGLMDRMMDDEELARMVIAAFLEDLPLQMAGLRDCLEAGDAPGAWRRVHTVRDAAMDAGAEALCAVANEMEKAAKVGDMSFVGRNLANLAAEFERAGETMGREL